MSRNTPWRTSRKQYALHQKSNDWYRIRNQVNGPTQLHIYDEIGYFGVSAGDMIRDLANVDGPVEVHLNSPGGEVFDGIAIYNALLARKDVTVIIDGLAASIASVIAMAGNPVLIARNAQMMVHDGFGMAIGNAQDLRELAELLDRTSNNIANIYSDHTGHPQDYWRNIMKAETWYDSAEAIEAGLADRLVDSGAGRQVNLTQPPGDKWDLGGAFRVDGTRSAPSLVNANQQTHAPMSGTHSHDHYGQGQQDAAEGTHNHSHTHDNDADHSHHAAWDPDGNGDDDSTPEGDTDHSHWAPDGTQKKSVPGKPLDSYGNRIDITNASVDNSPWDGGKAMSNAANADNPAGFYAGICAGKRSGDTSVQATWALPYRYTPNSAPNAAGVKNALSRLPQTQGLVNKEAAQSKLEGLMKQVNPDWEPSASLENPFGLSAEDFDRIARELRL
jgi:ATP-dependent protease ClpP protease subunit